MSFNCNFFYRNGPLVHHWTMRYEGKHRYFKHMANVLSNFTNVCYSLSLRHQLLQCYLGLNRYTVACEDIETGPCELILTNGFKKLFVNRYHHCFPFFAIL